MKDKIVILSRLYSRQPGERSALLLDALNFSMSNRLLGGGSACGKDSAENVQQTVTKSYHQSLSKDPAFINPLES